MKKASRVAALFLVWSFLFLIFFIYTFPAGTLKEWLEGHIERKTGLEVSIEGLEMGWNLALTAEGMDLKMPAGKGKGKFRMREISISPVFKTLLTGDPVIHFEGRVPRNGRITGRYMPKGERITIRWERVKTGILPAPILPSLLGKDSLIKGEGELKLVTGKDLGPSEGLRIKMEGKKGQRDLFFPPLPISREWFLTGRVSIGVERP